MAAERMSVGNLLTFFKGLEPVIKRKGAGEYGFPDEHILSWLRSLNGARNIVLTIPASGIAFLATKPSCQTGTNFPTGMAKTNSNKTVVASS